MSSLTLGPVGLFGSRQNSGKGTATAPPVSVRRFFMGKDFHQAAEFLTGIGLIVDRTWGCIHNLASCEGINGGILYVCPGADTNPEITQILTYMLTHNVRVIYLIEMIVDEVKQ